MGWNWVIFRTLLWIGLKKTELLIISPFDKLCILQSVLVKMLTVFCSRAYLTYLSHILWVVGKFINQCILLKISNLIFKISKIEKISRKKKINNKNYFKEKLNSIDFSSYLIFL